MSSISAAQTADNSGDVSAATTVVRGACPHDCPDTCALLTTVVDGKAVGVRGDPDHPFTRGALCAKVRDYEQRAYHPDRLLYPMRRAGEKGSGQFQRVTWDEALDEIAVRFHRISDEHGAEAILPCSYLGHQGLLNGLHCGDPFFNRLGASVAERTFCNAGATLAYNMTLGNTPGLDPESFVHARLIVIWACNIIGNMPHHWPFIREAQRRGARLVVVDPLRSRTAKHADWHIRPRPGTDGALALGLIRSLAEQGLVDDSYVADHVHGYEALRERAGTFTPERVAELTGLSSEDVSALAHEYGTTHPSAIRVGVAIERQANGPDTVRAICALPALVGAWRHVGGGLFQNAGRAFPINRQGLARPDLIAPGTRVVNLLSLGKALTGELPLDPPVKALFVYNSNPVSGSAEQEKVVSGLLRDDLFTVVSEHFMTDTARYADLLLPATTQLEQADLMYSWGHFYATYNHPAIAPVGEAVSNTELFRRLAARMGFTEPVFRRDDEQIARDSLDWEHPSLSGITLERLKDEGWARLELGEPGERRPHAGGGFPTPTGRCEIASTEAAKGTMVLTNFRQCYEAEQEGAPVDALPDYQPVGADADGSSLILVSPKTHYFLNSSYGNFDHHQRRNGRQWALLHPADALERGIAAGDDIVVKNESGRLQVEARIGDDTLRGVVVVPHGYWRDGADGGSVNVLNADCPTHIGKAPSFSDTRVHVAKAPPP